MDITAFALAQRWVGVKELPGAGSNPFVLGMLRLDNPGIVDDATPWCSALVNFIAWQLRLPRSKSLAARSWLGVGTPVTIMGAAIGFDVIVLKRGGTDQPGPEVMDAPGHVGFYAGLDAGMMRVLGGNQGDAVSIASFPLHRLLGVRRLIE